MDQDPSSTIEGSRLSTNLVPLYSLHSYRLRLLLILLLINAAATSLWSNLGIALVCMVSPAMSIAGNSTLSTSNALADPQCAAAADRSLGDHKTAALGYTGTLTWTTAQQSQLFAIFSYASLVTVTFSGYLADRTSPRRILSVVVFVYALLTMLSPLTATRLGYGAFAVLRACMGACDGFMFPCLSSLVSRWTPPDERATASSLYSSGSQFATMISVLVSARLCALESIGGWTLIFYVFGGIAIFVDVIFTIFVSDSPDESRFVRTKERIYLAEALRDQGLRRRGRTLQPLSFTTSKDGELQDSQLAVRSRISDVSCTTAASFAILEPKLKTPWRSILTSRAVLSIMLCELSFIYTNSIISNFLPSFFRDILALDIQSNSYMIAAPYLTQIVFKILISSGADALRRRYKFSSTTVCKVLQTISKILTALVLVVMALFLDCAHSAYAMALMLLLGASVASEICGAFTAILFIAPPFTGVLTSLMAGFGFVGSVLAPSSVSLLNINGTRAEWARVLYVCAAVNILAAIAFLVWGSAEKQAWAEGAVKSQPATQPDAAIIEQQQHDIADEQRQR